MKIAEALKFGMNKLKSRPTAHLEAEVILRQLTGLNREQLFLRNEEKVSAGVMNKFNKLLKLIESGYPLAYLVGEKELYGNAFFVDKNVLIPRPESEMLVEKGIELIGKNFGADEVNVADIGCGSGCLGISIALALPNVKIKLVDVSKRALNIAKKNVDKYKLGKRAKLVQGDLLNKLFVHKVDMIVANLPYIGTEKYNFVDKNVFKFEPHKALFAGKDGLDLYRKMFVQIKRMKYMPKLILGEFGFGQGNAIRQILNKSFVHKYEILADLSGIERIFIIKN